MSRFKKKNWTKKIKYILYKRNTLRVIHCFIFRIESYSCKMAGNDKRLFKMISAEGGVGPEDLQALSPPQTVLSLSPSK